MSTSLELVHDVILILFLCSKFLVVLRMRAIFSCRDLDFVSH